VSGDWMILDFARVIQSNLSEEEARQYLKDDETGQLHAKNQHGDHIGMYNGPIAIARIEDF
jgi:hypothetical protein